MNSDALDDFFALNAQLTALMEAGAPIVVGQDIPRSALPKSLERINAVVARRIRTGESLDDALQDDEVPAWYRAMMLSALRSRDRNEAFSARSRVANSVDESRHITESAFFYPFIVCVFAYIGLIIFCLLVVPTLESTYRDFNLDPKPGLKFLIYLRSTLFYWVALPPLLLALLIIMRNARKGQPRLSSSWSRGFLPRISGLSRGLSDECAAYFAESLAALEENEMPFDKALSVAAGACGDPDLAEGARALAGAVSANKAVNETQASDATRDRVPPFLRWAILDADATVGRGRALKMAASVYRQSAARRMDRSRVIAPIIVLVTVGGGVTLLYALALFNPILNLLSALSR